MTEDALGRQRKVRGAHRASATRLMGQAETLKTATPVDLDEVVLIQTSLSSKLKTLGELDAALIELTPEEQLEEEIGRADEYSENIRRTLLQLDKILSPKTTPVETTRKPESHRSTPSPRATETGGGEGSVTPSGSRVSETTGSSVAVSLEPRPPADDTRSSDRIKLPKIGLPHFRGELVKWTAFWDSFDSAIHSNDRLPEIDKFNYLRSLLEGCAHDAIAGLSLSSANYSEAVEILKHRFGNKHLIVSKHMEALLSISTVASDEHLRELRKLYDEAETNIRSLRTLGIEPESYGAMLSSVLLNKLPRELRLIVSRRISADDLNVEVILKVFEEELSARERAQNTGATAIMTPHRRHHNRPMQTSAFAVSDPGDPMCVFCQQPHFAAKCNIVKEIESRRKVLKDNGRCYNCLRKNHLARNCPSRSRCRQCHGRHHTSICGKDSKPQSAPTSTAGPDLNPEATPFHAGNTISTLCSDQGKVTVLLQTARAVIYNPVKPTRRMEIRILFDSGSQRSYLTERVRARLRLKPLGEQTLSIATFGAVEERTQVSPVVSVGIRLKGYPDGAMPLYVVPTICEPLSFQPVKASVMKYSHLTGLDLADATDGPERLPIDALIGCDQYWNLVTGSICRGKEGPTALHTKLGWVLSGATVHGYRTTSSLACNVSTHSLTVDTCPTGSKELEESLRSFWELESMGVRETERTLYDEFSDGIVFRNGRYKVCLPWKESHRPLGDNYSLSLRRLQGLLKRLRHNPELSKQYDSTIRDQLEKGVIEPVTAGEETTNPIHYLPHHAVVRGDKSTTKLRVVYDASSGDSGPSLNECLYKGPKFHQLIFDLLVRFRAYRVGLVADVEKAFLMIEVDQRDRDVLRFIWVDDVTKAEPDLRIFRFTRVVFGVSASPFLLNATVKYHLQRFMESNRDVVERLLCSTYVDDVVSGAETDEQAFDLYAQSKNIFRQGGFNLRKFQSNSKVTQAKIDEIEGTSSEDRLEEVKVLGITWNSSSDSLIYDLSDLSVAADALQPTKRNVMSMIGRIYDPLGFLAPVTIKFKILFQQLCQTRLDWDCDITEDLLREWESLLDDFRKAIPISIPRSYHHRSESLSHSTHALHGFCDASTKAYAAVVYLVIQSEGRTAVEFVASKSRVAPLQPQTIPRLELLSALLLARLMTSIVEILSPVVRLDSLQCYTDSQVALCWIRGIAKEWKPFVSNRVKEIRKKVHPDNWSHCPGISNPADLPSRGLSPRELSVSHLWRQGPEWLPLGLGPSPPKTPEPGLSFECARELKEDHSHSLAVVEPKESGIWVVLEVKNYSTFSRLVGVTASVIRALRLFKNLLCQKRNLPLHKLNAVGEKREAELLWVKSAQGTLVDLRNKTSQFGLFKDSDGVWRCGGRLANAEIPYASRCPILLPADHPITPLIVRQAHERVMHNGVKETLVEVRTKYWIPRGRRVTRAIIHQCVVCRRFEGGPYKTPQPPPLPPCRVKEAPAFSYTGVDFAGPLMVRGTSRNDFLKVWIALFTCYVTRAVHLDTVQDQSTMSFIRCLKRFVARRGLPRRFISDNGKTFKAASSYLNTMCKEKVVEEHLRKMGSIVWQFNVERAPWWGGAFERMVQSTKRCLRKVVGRAHFSLDELTTTVAEIEAVLNSRPLSYVSSDDLEEPITPAHLMLGYRLLSLPDDLDHTCDLNDPEFRLDKSRAIDRVKHQNNVLNHFWKRWRTEYLGHLREVHSHCNKNSQSKQNRLVSVGDVVVVRDDQLPRGRWRLGVIVEVMRGRDGVIRAASVRVAVSGERRQSVLKRPIQLLYPLEISCDGIDLPGSPATKPPVDPRECPPESDEPSQPTSVTLARPRRVAAQKSEELRRRWIRQLQEPD